MSDKRERNIIALVGRRNDLENAIKGIVAAWETGDLAAAVNSARALVEDGPEHVEVTDAWLISAAKEIARIYSSDEDAISFDDAPKVSRGEEDGAYVQAWIWVRYPELA